MFQGDIQDMLDKVTVGEVVSAFLEQCGVGAAFGVISIHNMPFLDAIGRRKNIRFIASRGEAGAVNMADAYAISDLIVCRSGALTLAEITVCGKPSILIPYPYAAGDHQTKNAMALSDQDAAFVIKDQDADEYLGNHINRLIADKVQRDISPSSSSVSSFIPSPTQFSVSVCCVVVFDWEGFLFSTSSFSLGAKK